LFTSSSVDKETKPHFILQENLPLPSFENVFICIYVYIYHHHHDNNNHHKILLAKEQKSQGAKCAKVRIISLAFCLALLSLRRKKVFKNDNC